MQFHKNGYRTGDPAFKGPTTDQPTAQASDPLPADVDVLIVGSGPTGLTLAAQLSAFPELTVALAEAKPGPLKVGQADGIACRSVEMFHAFGFAHKILHEAYWVNETNFWKPDPNQPDKVRRSHRIQDVEDGLSEMPHVILNQARVHDAFLEVMSNAERPTEPHYDRRFIGLDRPTAEDEPVTARFETSDGTIETVKARYVVGCDGARSQVRRSIGRELVGDAANQAWGVMDVLGVTDFPDIRFKVIMHAAAGNLVIIPREGGFLTRFYIDLGKLDVGERAFERNIGIDDIVEAANRILHPYTLTTAEVPWWSVYEIGQRMTDQFDDAGPADTDQTGQQPRVFIAGDACHTHSPKAGQGMNVSMRDGYNLGWKLASVLRGQADPTILNTYTTERHAVAKELIDFDRELSAMMSARPEDDQSVDPGEFARYFQQHGRFMAGVATKYNPSLLTADSSAQDLASGFVIGTRFHSSPVVRVADGRIVELGQTAMADGRWRLYAFADSVHPGSPDSRMAALCRFLADDDRSPLARFTPRDADVDADSDAMFDLRAVFQDSHHELTVNDLPALLKPRVGKLSLIDYEKAFCSTFKAGTDIYTERGINREQGALVIVRPDQHVAHVLSLDAYDDLGFYFGGFLLEY